MSVTYQIIIIDHFTNLFYFNKAGITNIGFGRGGNFFNSFYFLPISISNIAPTCYFISCLFCPRADNMRWFLVSTFSKFFQSLALINLPFPDLPVSSYITDTRVSLEVNPELVSASLALGTSTEFAFDLGKFTL